LSPFVLRLELFMRAQLVPLDGAAPIEILKDLTVVGRKDDCDLRLEHKSVSKMHCVLVKTEGMLFVRDLGSTNGTRVNGKRVRRSALLLDDQLSIANYKFRIHLGPEEVAVAPIAPEEHTQQLDAEEVADLLRKAKQKALEDSSGDLPPQPLHPNPLPDVYPDDEQERPAR
jgi:pSer/pThr/pTyr-binding forkhead associated (FHA) protein